MGFDNSWQIRKIGNCAELIRDHFKPNGEGTRPYIGLEHIQQQTLKLLDVGKSTDVVSDKFVFKSGDILFGKLRPYFRKVVRPKFDGVCSTDIWVIRAKEDTDQGFLYYLMASEKNVALASQGSEGTKMPRARWDFVENIEVPLPPLPEQQKIASILGALDDKIELNHEMNKTLEEMAQTIFKHWFMDFEFPDENGKPYKSSGGEMVYSEELDKEIPKGWEVKPIDEIADFLNGLALQKYPPKNENYLPVIKIRELRQGITESSDKASPDIDKRYIVDDGDVLFSWSGSLEVCIWCGGQGALNQHLFKVTSQTYPKWFYYQWIKFYLPKFQHIAKGKATTMGHIRRHHLSETYVIVPFHEVMEKMNEIMGPLMENFINNSIESLQLANLRDTLLPKLLSGEIRVQVNNGTNVEVKE